MLTRDKLYIAGNAKPNSGNPITYVYDRLILVLIIDKKTGEILDTDLNSVCELTKQFIKELLVGYSLMHDLDVMIHELQTRYFGLSQKTIIACLKDAYNKMRESLEKLEELGAAEAIS